MGKHFDIPPRPALAEFCQRHHVRRLSLFGSVVHGDFDADSDVDVLVEFEAGHTPGFFRLFDLQQELSQIFWGRTVDLRTPQDLSRYFRNQVLAEAQVQYAAK